jgi:hypothetical protein
MNKRITALIFAGVMGMVMLLSGGCCLMHRHNNDRPPCGGRSSDCGKPCCKKTANCDKPCCDKPPADCPMAEQKK